MMNLFKKSSVFLLASALFTSTTLFAQEVAPVAAPTTPTTSPSAPTSSAPAVNSQMMEYYKQAKSAGMSDIDIERAAIQRGMTIDQINAIKSSMIDEGKTSKEQKNVDPTVDDTREQSNLEDIDGFDEFNEEDILVGKSSASGNLGRLFGASFFSKVSPTFEPNLRIATPKNYVLGPEDELIIDISGNYSEHITTKVSPEGTIKLYNLAPIVVAGMKLEDASERIIGRLQTAYSGLNKAGSGTSANITLGSIRSIKVMVAGEAQRPGTYTVSSLATAFNALYVSGGPNSNGSFRNIQVIRDNKVVRNIDLYKFLTNGNLEDNINLQDQDIILIKPYQSRISLFGQVKRTGTFELLSNETFDDLLQYAGGYRPEALINSINFRRNNGLVYELGSFTQSESKSFIPQNGDRIFVSKIIEIIPNYIEIAGSVVRPGIYPYEEKNNTVKKLIESAYGIVPKTYMGRAIIERETGDNASIVAFNLQDLMDGKIEDIPLMIGDKLSIRSIEDLRDERPLVISGSVRNPGTFLYRDGMTLEDLIFKAGGFTDAGISYNIEVSRRVKNDTIGLSADQNVRVYNVSTNFDLTYNYSEKDFKLSPYDRVFVRSSSRFESQKLVTVSGEVQYPGQYAIVRNQERISDLIPKVGGLKNNAYLEGARFIRNGELVALDLGRIVKNPKDESNILLIPGDILQIPTKSEVIRIQGGVQNPSLINHQESFKYSDYLNQAGGYVENAYKKRVYVSYPNGRTKRIKRSTEIMPGSTITVPVKQVQVQEKMTRSERIAILSLLTTATIAIIRLF